VTQDQFRLLPSVDDLVTSLANLERRFPRSLLVSECRLALAAARDEIRAGRPAPTALATRVTAALESLEQPSLRRVLNATGVILHTNLGRAPLPALPDPAGYSNLEYDLAQGRRGKRDSHLGPLLERLLGAPAIAVNNGAAAVWLVLHELAAGGEVIVSRGELIEIGDGFRIPDIMARSGARLVEVGATNRTRIEDYRHAITPHTRLLMRVHPSNFRMEGFTGRPSLEELTSLGRETGLPVYEDLGSGCFLDLRAHGVHEPTAQASLRAGVSLVSFSGDKLLGGSQAGLIAGDAALLARIRRNPMFRAMRIDKLSTLSLETALRSLLLERWDHLPVLRMIRLTPEQIRARAARLAARLPGAEVLPGQSLLGGGATPEQSLPTFLLALPGDAVALERRLRQRPLPVIARIDADRLLLDLRTIAPEEEDDLLAALLSL
jgi:L-seryl-tRNA(Ser) seleniumtransferase